MASRYFSEALHADLIIQVSSLARDAEMDLSEPLLNSLFKRLEEAQVTIAQLLRSDSFQVEDKGEAVHA